MLLSIIGARKAANCVHSGREGLAEAGIATVRPYLPGLRQHDGVVRWLGTA
jgi:hypothetical protein